MQEFSLIWPAGMSAETPGLTQPLSDETIRDLGLAFTVETLQPGEEHRKDIQNILYNLCVDPVVIRYRQDVIEELSFQPLLLDCLQDLLPEITLLASYLARQKFEVVRQKPSLFQLANRLRELKVFVDCINRLEQVFKPLGNDLCSEGMKRLRAFVMETEQDRIFQNLVKELPAILSEVENHASVTIGVNLDSTLQPVAATLISVNSRKFTNSKLLNRLVGSEVKMLEGIADLHTLANTGISADGPIDPMMVPLFRDLETVLSKVTRSIDQALKKYVGFNTGILVGLKKEIVFYLAAIKLIRLLGTNGLPMCRPELAPVGERVCNIQDNFNLNLAFSQINKSGEIGLKDGVVQNQVVFDPHSRTMILTGPNQGGKTTYLQAVGLTQVLTQAGFFVPGSQARLSPVDNIFTHYPIEESLEKGTGRFGDEAKRLNEIFMHMTRFSLVLLNESLSSTSPGESLYLAQDIVRVLLKMGVRSIFATHLHELAAGVDVLNADASGDSKAASLVASFVLNMDEKIRSDTPIKRTYKVDFSPPMGHSCARELAAHYRIGYEQLVEMLDERGVLDNE